MGPDGTTTIAWIDASGVHERTRPAAGGAFAAKTDPANALSSPYGVSVASGGDGSAIIGWSGQNAVPVAAVAAARRGPAASTFTSLGSSSGTNNSGLVLAADDEGNAPSAFLTQASGQYTIRASAIDAAGPSISNVTFPSTADAGTPFSYGATLSDRWSTASGAWAFGDSTSGPLSGSKNYANGGSFNAALTATDAVGNTSTATKPITVTGSPLPDDDDPPADRDVIAPSFSTAGLTAKKFAVNKKGLAETPVELAARAKAKKGTTFVFTLSEAAKVIVAIDKQTVGRKDGSACVKATKKNRDGKKCKLYKSSGAFAVDAISGENLHAFSGRIGTKSLKPGKYRATLTATDDAGNKSNVETLTFKVVKRK